MNTHANDNPSSGRVFYRVMSGGILWGAGWGFLYWCQLLFNGHIVPFSHAFIYGVILGVLFGLCAGVILSIFESSSRTKKIWICGSLISVIFSCIGVLFSPTTSYFLLNASIVIFVSALLIPWAVKPVHKKKLDSLHP